MEAKIHEEWKKAGKEVPDAVWSYIGQDTPKAKALAKTRYERFEYYRASSIAKSMYMQALQGKVGEEKILTDMSDLTVCTGNEKLQTCQCANCLRRKRSEHMRWNAYMRVNGYSYQAGMRADRAKLHDNLTGWDSLSVQDREKD